MVGRSDETIWARPAHAGVGRPAERSREEITDAALALADRDGLDAVSMRRVATELGTGAASLYRYLDTREDLLDLMVDATAAEYVFRPPSGDWLADLTDLGGQARAIMLRHPWLCALIAVRPAVGPRALALLDHVLDLLADHPAPGPAKLEAFAILTAVTAMTVQGELAIGSAAGQRYAVHLGRAVADGDHPRLARALAETTASDGRDVLARILTGLLGPAPRTGGA